MESAEQPDQQLSLRNSREIVNALPLRTSSATKATAETKGLPADWSTTPLTLDHVAKRSAKEEWAGRCLIELFPSVCGLSCRPVTAGVPDVPEADTPALRRATPARRWEFSTGRTAARDALGQAGLQNAIIPQHVNRSPIWPAGYIGSIAHADGIAVAAAAKTENVAAMGVDLEIADAVTESLWPDVLASEEIARIHCLPPMLRRRCATVIFSAKEAFYKFQFPHTQAWLEFHDVMVTVDPAQQTFTVTTALPLTIGGRSLTTFAGSFRAGEQFVMTAVLALPNGRNFVAPADEGQPGSSLPPLPAPPADATRTDVHL